MSLFLPRHTQSGFTLIMMSILLTVAALALVSVLPGQEAGDVNQKNATNMKKLERVEEAMRSFMTLNGRRPCPADGQYAENTPDFGVEAGTPGTCTGNATLPNAPLGPSNHVVGGVIPTKTLGLPDDYAYDEFGRRFTYVVDQRATDSWTTAKNNDRVAQCPVLAGLTSINSTPVGPGGVVIENTAKPGGTVIDNVMYAYISYGKSGDGAFPAQGSPTRISTGSNDVDMQNNAFTGGFSNVLVSRAPVAATPGDTGFDDLVWYRPDIKNTCCLGASCVQHGFIAAGINSDDFTGSSVAVGDVNGDGIPDLIIGAPGANGGAGAVYVVFGNRTGFPDPLPLNTLNTLNLNGSNGFELEGSGTRGGGPQAIGGAIAVADVNGDGYADILFSGRGSADVVFGGYTGANNSMGTAWSSCPSSSPCPVASGTSTSFLNGINGAEFDTPGIYWTPPIAAGNVNGGGFADIIIGQSVINGSSVYGLVYVVMGHTGSAAWAGGTGWAGGTNGLFSLDGSGPNYLMNGTNGTEFLGPFSSSRYGAFVAAGDVNGDGYDDLITGSGSCAGATIISGGANFLQAIPTTTLAAPITGGCCTGYIANVVSAAGFQAGQVVNMQNVPFGTIISNISGNTIYMSNQVGVNIPAGTTFSVYGQQPTNGVTSICGSNISAATVGDVKGVGIKGLILGAPGSSTGAVYVLFGPISSASNITLISGNAPLDGINGGEFDGAYYSLGNLVAVAVGDINGDGISDLIIGAPGNVLNGATTGSAFVVFGNTSLFTINSVVKPAITLNSAFLNGITGAELDGSTYSDAGNSVAAGDVNGDGIADLIVGALGAKTDTGEVYVYFGHKGTGNNPWPVSSFQLNGL